MGSHSFLQEIFLTQGSNPGILYCRKIFFFTIWDTREALFLDYIIQQFHFLVSEENQNTNLKRYSSRFIASLFAIGKTGKHPKCPSMSGWTLKYSLYTQWNITQPVKEKEILPFATTWMDLEDAMMSEISQTEKDKYCVISHFMWNKKKTPKLIDTENRLKANRR